MKPGLATKKILITGGNSRLGREIVRKAAAEGAQVYFTYRRDSEIVKELTGLGAKSYRLDLSDMRAIDDFAKTFKADAGGLDVLIHNAAHTKDTTIQNMTEEDWDSVMTVDLKAPFYLTKKLLSLLFKSEQAKIFMIISRIAQTGAFGAANYAAAKAGMVGLAKSLAQELGKKKILVNAVNPGFMESEMTQDISEITRQKHLDDSPLRAHSRPEEVADFIVYMCSDRMTQVTGQVIHFESRKV